MNRSITAALLAGLAGGTADILTAFFIYRPASPVMILQAVASGVLGKASFQGGLPAAATGLVSHFAIAIVFAAIFVAVARGAPIVLRHPLFSGLGFGIVVFGVMNAIVVPLSLAPPRQPPEPTTVLLGLFAHALFGLALAFTAARVLKAQTA